MAKKAAKPVLVESAQSDTPEPAGGDMLIDHGEVMLGRFFKVTPTGLTVTGRPSLEICGDLGEFLRVFEKSIQFSIGDYVNWVESMYGEEASQLIDSSAWSESTIKVYRWVTAKIAPQNRRMEAGLSFGHHQLVAELEPSQQVLWLERAQNGDGDGSAPWSVQRLRRELQAAKAGRPVVANADIYQVIVNCESQADVDALCRQLDNLGRTDYKTKTSE